MKELQCFEIWCSMATLPNWRKFADKHNLMIYDVSGRDCHLLRVRMMVSVTIKDIQPLETFCP